jgi:hypothetical protein
LLDIQRDLESFLVKSRARAGIRSAADASGVFEARSDFSQIKPRHMLDDFSIHRYNSSKPASMDAPNSAEVERNQSNLVALAQRTWMNA